MRADITIKPTERVDDLHRNGYRLIQDPKGFCFGVDAVLLSGFALVKKGENMIDLGTGTGVIPILAEAKNFGSHYTGLEIQGESVDMARRSVALNELSHKITIVEGDIKEAAAIFGGSQFDVVTSNPPYMNSGGGIINDFGPLAIARHEILCTLNDVVGNASKLLKSGGRFYMIHRPHRLVDIMCTFRQYKLEPKRLRFVHSHFNKEPSMVLIEGTRGGKPLLKTEAPLIIYDSNGNYTEEIQKIYYE